ncbi:unnamed protein product [Thlaspi arvense]|uniref:F-box associated beta-propeller type 1 domain-containing protein n=1 Tax=Thlaspi arvense TaxID=13288 RepID=A0AAU9RQV2_THLAR|nr:unnamed protein product [Thlaspi arvense]
MTSSLSSLPLELVKDIFSRARVPIELLARFKTTSKEWYAFFNDKKFIYKLLDPSQERFIQVDEFDRKSIQIFNPETKALLRLPFSDESHNYVVSETMHCDGLLLCECIERGTYYDDDTFKLAVWNPILRGVTWIEPSNSYRRSDVHGFGYDNVSRDNYKILRINKDELPSEIEIYEFKSKLWRSVDATLECDHMWDSAVSINGNMFWIARTVNSEIFIQSFDFPRKHSSPYVVFQRKLNGIKTDYTCQVSEEISFLYYIII